MWFDGIVEVDEPAELRTPIGRICKGNWAVPHIHERTDNPLSLPVGLQPIDAGKLLTDTVLPASFIERMIVSSFKFFTVVRISIVYLLRTLGSSVCEKGSGAMLGFIRKNIGYSSLEKSSMATNRYSRDLLVDCPFKKGDRLYRSEQAHLGKICCSAWQHA